ncbi:MAG: metal-dependent phosphohydrolase [Drouetiella hepatica Uher 2000/2452]|jgi:DICT domain-containing protein|uniref:Metal-dependent phosphohydrolase n=1 Tax=Drouetiella hepatica Uher 2000/2452 TaxID=904376 RepID=A0A951QDC9_9CYAN|nr:metal-dependent phosphohydrolase [Drouetiella hepatica Uher 2000/2452]
MLEGSILDKLRSAHLTHHPDKPPLNFGVYYKNTLVALCHALEDAILDADYSPLMITAFQRGKWYLEEADRYGEIAGRSRQIVILAAPDGGFGDHPTSQRSNVALVSLEEADPVAQEWHLVILSPNYTAMVLCQELSEADYGVAGFPTEDLERKFYGLWTFEPALVLETVELLVEHVGRYNPALQQRLKTQVEEMAPLVQGAFCSVPTVEHMGDIVSRVVDYLQTRETTSPLAQLLPTSSLDNNLTSNELQAFLRVAQLIDQTDISNPMVAAEVAALSEAMGQLLDLPSWQLHRLRLAGLLHRIALLQSYDRVLSSVTSVSDSAESPDQAPYCPLVPGIQVLRRMQRLSAIATILTHQSEWWNGAGLPARLAGDGIPIESRILGLVAEFQRRVVEHRDLPLEEALVAALADCQVQQGDRWDPKLVEALGLLVTALQQGLSLPVAMPKIASGLWLLDSYSQENIQIAYGGNSITSTVEKTHGH